VVAGQPDVQMYVSDAVQCFIKLKSCVFPAACSTLRFPVRCEEFKRT
jgi:hypothetical protein